MKCAVVAVGLTLLGSTGVAVAGPIGQTGQFTWTREAGYYTGSGGEFTIGSYTGIDNQDYVDTGVNLTSTKNITTGASFETFCLETAEFAASPSYFVVSDAAARGGTVSSTDALSKGTAWLYSKFATGALNVTGGNYFSAADPARSTEAGRLQQAIWWLEEEGGALVTTNDGNYTSNPYAAAAVTQFGGTIAGAKASATSGYLGVYVLNNFKTAEARDQWVGGSFNNTEKAQDFLYYSVPDGGTTLMLLGGALVTLGAYRRKLNR